MKRPGAAAIAAIVLALGSPAGAHEINQFCRWWGFGWSDGYHARGASCANCGGFCGPHAGMQPLPWQATPPSFAGAAWVQPPPGPPMLNSGMGQRWPARSQSVWQAPPAGGPPFPHRPAGPLPAPIPQPTVMPVTWPAPAPAAPVYQPGVLR